MKDSATKKKQTICNSSNNDRYENHRINFRSCPCCPHEMESGEWDKVATTLILNPRNYKAGSVAILSECPKCFEESWVHHPMDSFDWGEYPKAWKECVKKLEKEVKLQAVREWGKCLCHKCSNLKEAKIEYNCRISCSGDYGSISCNAEMECEHFKELK